MLKFVYQLAMRHGRLVAVSQALSLEWYQVAVETVHGMATGEHPGI